MITYHHISIYHISYVHHLSLQVFFVEPPWNHYPNDPSCASRLSAFTAPWPSPAVRVAMPRSCVWRREFGATHEVCWYEVNLLGDNDPWFSYIFMIDNRQANNFRGHDLVDHHEQELTIIHPSGGGVIYSNQILGGWESPVAGGFISWKNPNYEWMVKKGVPYDSGNHHMDVDISTDLKLSIYLCVCLSI